jgi:hypothetical protein
MQGTLSAMVALFMWTGNLTWYFATFLSSTLHRLFQEPHGQGEGDSSGYDSSGDSSSSSSSSKTGGASFLDRDGSNRAAATYVLPPCEVKSPELGFWSSDGDFGMSGSTFTPPNLTCHNWEVLPVAATSCVIVSVPQLPTLAVLINTFAVSMFVTAFVVAFLCYLAFGHILLNTTARHGWGLPGWVRTISVTAHFTLVYFAPSFDEIGGQGGDERRGGGGGGGGVRGGGGNMGGSGATIPAAGAAGAAAPAAATGHASASVGANASAAASGSAGAGAALSSAGAPAAASAAVAPAATPSAAPAAVGSTREQLIRQFSEGGNNDGS